MLIINCTWDLPEQVLFAIPFLARKEDSLLEDKGLPDWSAYQKILIQ